MAVPRIAPGQKPFIDILPSFARGEITPSLYGRVDIQAYMAGCKTLRNMIVMPQGGATRRMGTFYVASTKYPTTNKARLIPFEFNVTQAYILEFGNYYMRVYMNDGQVQVNGSPYEISTPWADTDLPNLKYTQSADTMFLCHPNYPPYTLTRTSHTNWVLAPYNYVNGPFMPINSNPNITIQPSAKTGTVTLTASGGNVWNPQHVGALWQLTHYVAEQGTVGSSVTFNAAGQTTPTIQGQNMTWRFIAISTNFTGNVVIDKQLIINGVPTGNWEVYRTYQFLNGGGNVNEYGTDPDNCMMRARCTAATNSINVTFTADPMDVNGICQITAYTSPTQVTASVFPNTPFGDTTATSLWYEGAWSTYRGWPSAVTFYQDRLVWGGTASQPQTVWMSKTSSYYDFGVSDPAADTDTISVNLLSRKMNKINSLVSLLNIVALTSSSNWSIGPPELYGTITPSHILQTYQGERGANNIDPIVIDNRILYIQQLGNIVRDLTYQYWYNTYLGEDLTIFSNHLLRGHNIIAWAYQMEPYSVIWMIREDGIMLSLTYHYEQQILGWARHDTLGQFESIAVCPNLSASTGYRYSEVWLVVNRPWGRCIERMAPKSYSTDPSDMYYVDCGLQYGTPIAITGITSTNPVTVTAPNHGFVNNQLIGIFSVNWTPTYDANGNPVTQNFLNYGQYLTANVTTNTFTLVDPKTGNNIDGTSFTPYVSGGYAYAATQTVSGLSYLAGQTVAILADGNVLPQQVVPSNGIITLPVPASKISIGLPFTSQLQTLNIEYQTDDGTAQGQLVNIPSAVIRVEASRGGKLSIEPARRLYDWNLRSTELMGNPLALFTGDKKVDFGPSYERNGTVFIQQSDPLPLTILAIIPKMVKGGFDANG